MEAFKAAVPDIGWRKGRGRASLATVMDYPFASRETTGTICASPGAGFAEQEAARLLPAQLDAQSAHHPHRDGFPSGLYLRVVGPELPTNFAVRQTAIGCRESPRKLRAATAGAASCDCT